MSTIYVESTTGLKVDAATATENGTVRPGYRQVLQNGERVHFDIMMRDGSSSGPVFLTDEPASITDAELAAFAQTREGQGIQSLAMKQYQDSTRYLHNPPPFDATEINRALRDALAAKKRNEGLYQDMRQDIDRAGKNMRDFARDASYS